MSLQIGENKSRLAYLYESMSSTQKQNTTQTQQSESGSAEDHFSPEVCPILQTFPQKSVYIRREGSHYIDYQITDHVFAGFCILQIGQIGQFDVFGYIADGSAYCLRNLA